MAEKNIWNSQRLLAHEYYILVTGENGNPPAMRQEESRAGLVAAGIMDLCLGGIISVKAKKNHSCKTAA